LFEVGQQLHSEQFQQSCSNSIMEQNPRRKMALNQSLRLKTKWNHYSGGNPHHINWTILQLPHNWRSRVLCTSSATFQHYCDSLLLYNTARNTVQWSTV